ncbi:hypothetical protein [Corynebacterium pseudopelargi]|uniref:Uncharacterized protein n=1 Tax=Corynebacterium pseudopelargi TaxID=2080757 RepID=A0A3G6IWM4_9CORY|nr:hypothetical protein [Corynebacterium pseudopelargi]AZA10102.1 hypothetical protein CPPEL_10015 [Corynebacterium pseudopelargi]
MGRLILIILLIAAIWIAWRAFGPSSWKKNTVEPEAIKGPDDDPEFLWKLEKERFKQQREQERLEKERRQRGEGEDKQKNDEG